MRSDNRVCTSPLIEYEATDIGTGLTIFPSILSSALLQAPLLPVIQ